MNELSELPRRSGFHFIGVLKTGEEVKLRTSTVRDVFWTSEKDDQGYMRNFYDKDLTGWKDLP